MWMEKYRPKGLDEYIFSSERTKDLVEKFIKEKNFPHLFLHGLRGTGKTSLAYLLRDELGIDPMDFKKIAASDENSVENIRTTVKNFITTYAIGDFKVVFLDEADRLTPAAQDCLKSMMEDEAHNARFIIACNKPHKVIEELQSRCTKIGFSSVDPNQALLRLVKILKAEGVKVPSLDVLDQYVEAARNDFRSLLNLVQANVKNGEVLPFESQDEKFEIKVQSLLMVGEGDWNGARELLVGELSDDDYEDMYRFYYDNLLEVDKFKDDTTKWKRAIVIISDYLERHDRVGDVEINFAACLIKLSEI